MSLDPDRIRQVASGYRLSQLVYACPSLGVPDVLLSGPATADNVADTIGAVPGLVSRLLRAAASEGVVDFAAGRYQLNDFSRQLCSAPDGPMREFVLGWSTLRTGYLAFGYLDQAIKSGHSGVELLTGQCFHEHLRATSEEAARYAAAMEETGDGFRAVAEAYHFGRYRRIVDVGGGQGTFPIAIRQRYPNVSGVLFDLPDVVAWAPAQLAGYPEAAGITVTAGDMFVDIPEGGDAYLFLHRSALLHRRRMPPRAPTVRAADGSGRAPTRRRDDHAQRDTAITSQPGRSASLGRLRRPGPHRARMDRSDHRSRAGPSPLPPRGRPVLRDRRRPPGRLANHSPAQRAISRKFLPPNGPSEAKRFDADFADPRHRHHRRRVPLPAKPRRSSILDLGLLQETSENEPCYSVELDVSAEGGDGSGGDTITRTERRHPISPARTRRAYVIGRRGCKKKLGLKNSTPPVAIIGHSYAQICIDMRSEDVLSPPDNPAPRDLVAAVIGRVIWLLRAFGPIVLGLAEHPVRRSV